MDSESSRPSTTHVQCAVTSYPQSSRKQCCDSEWCDLGWTTIVLMMCVRKIREFTQRMVEQLGYPSDLGVAVVHKMSLEDQVVIHSDLENIADAIRDRKMSSPAVFVIGHVTETRFGAGVGVYSSRFEKEEMESSDETKMVVVS